MKIRIKRSSYLSSISKCKIRPAAFFSTLAVICMPFSTISIAGVGILLLIGGPLLYFCIPSLISRLKRKKWDKATVLLTLFFIYGLLGYVWAPSFNVSSVYNYIKNVLIVMCLYCQKYNEQEKGLLCFGSLLSCLIVFYFIFSGNGIGYIEGRMSIAVFGQMQDPNYIGFVFIAPLAIAFDRLFSCSKTSQKLLYSLFCILVFYSILITGSRGAFLGIATVIFISIIYRFNKLSEKILFFIIMLLILYVLFGIITVYLPDQIAARFSFAVVYKTGGTGRVDIWLNTLNALMRSKENILFGFGTGSSYSVIRRATHNYFLQLLLELGVVGAGLFCGFLFQWIKRLKSDSMSFSIVLGCLALSMSLSVNTNYYFWITLILGIISSKKNK